MKYPLGLSKLLRPACTNIKCSVGSPSIRTTVRPNHTKSLQNSKCLITGGSRGIGKAIALAFARQGAQCTLIGRNAENLRTSVAELGQTSSASPRPFDDSDSRHTYLAGDVSNPKFWQDVTLPHGGVDVLVNAAGITHSALLVRTQTEKAREIVDTNLMGTIWACRAIGKIMLRKRAGCIVNISSLLGVHGGEGSAVYAASKAGVVGLTRALAAELGPKGVRVNAVLPGYVETDMTAGRYINSNHHDFECPREACSVDRLQYTTSGVIYGKTPSQLAL